MPKNAISIKIGGEAGQGVESGGSGFARALVRGGHEVVVCTVAAEGTTDDVDEVIDGTDHGSDRSVECGSECHLLGRSHGAEHHGGVAEELLHRRHRIGVAEVELFGHEPGSFPGAIRAIDPQTGTVKWNFDLHLGSVGAGVLSTAGGVVFAGAKDGNLIALDARTGAELWHYQTGAEINASPISYSVDGKQYVAMALGNSLYVFHVQ
mgnify:CR=1 FL=1